MFGKFLNIARGFYYKYPQEIMEICVVAENFVHGLC